MNKSMSTNEVRRHLQQLGAAHFPSVAAVTLVATKVAASKDGRYWELRYPSERISAAIVKCIGVGQEESIARFAKELRSQEQPTA